MSKSANDQVFAWKEIEISKKFSISGFRFGVIKHRYDGPGERVGEGKKRRLALQHKWPAMIRAKQHQPPGWVVSLLTWLKLKGQRTRGEAVRKKPISLEEKKKIEVTFD